MNERTRKLVRLAPWALLALPGLYQLWLLARAVAGRLGYPYDLEWMEGGLLLHAARLAEGAPIYTAPSLEFIPYLYTPLYPAIVAVLGQLFGIGYVLGRAISVLSIVAILVFAALAILRGKEARRDPFAWCGAILAGGLFAASYPLLDGWYDLVRADTLFLAMVIGGLLALRAWSGRPGLDGHLRVGVVAALLAFSFFCKQTGVFYVAVGGVLLLFYDWKRVPIYIAISGMIGLGGTWLLDRTSSGWFWTYIFGVHQAHDFNIDRVWASFGFMLWKWFPVTTVAILLGLFSVGAAAAVRRELPPSARPLLTWSFVFAVSCVVGAVGWGTQWAHFNAYMPAMATGAIAAGAAIPALADAARALVPKPPKVAPVAAGALSLALGAQLLQAGWAPGAFVPTEEDRRAGDRLIDWIRNVEGEVMVPFHPWYLRLAGKETHSHRMGFLDMRYSGTWEKSGLAEKLRDLGILDERRAGRWEVEGLEEALRSHRFDAVLLDNRPVGFELAELRRYYRPDDDLPGDHRPRVYSGAGAMWKTRPGLPPGYRRGRKLVPKQIWVPARPTPPPEGARVLFNFEEPELEGWTIEGRAWGRSAVSRPLPRQGPVRRYGGRYFVTSFHGGDRTTGTLLSPPFALEGEKITLRLSGGRNPERLRAELRVGDEVIAEAAPVRDSDRMEVLTWEIGEHRGEEARIALVDEATGSWGHLNADEIWIWQ